MSTAVSTVIGVPVTVSLYPPAAIPIAVLICIATGIVIWHLSKGRRAHLRRTPKGTLTFTLDSVGRHSTTRGRR